MQWNKEDSSLSKKAFHCVEMSKILICLNDLELMLSVKGFVNQLKFQSMRVLEETSCVHCS